MCGIAGQISKNTIAINTNSVLDSFAHRGPNAQDDKILNCAHHQVWLGHARLSILDLSEAGAQPMQSHNQTWQVVFNGEIYNHTDLRDSSHNYRGHSDTETLIELLSQKGIDNTLPLLNGMYAFAALDQSEKKIHLVRDPFGIKPLYFHLHNGTLSFASELRTLYAMGVHAEICHDALQTFLSLRYTPSPQTLLRGIQRLPPGHHLTFDLNTSTLKIERFIHPTKHRFVGPESVAIRSYEFELRNAVSRQLLSDVPVGLLLSGGIDSALVAAMAKEQGTELKTYTVGFGDQHHECEISDAEHTAQILGLPNHSITVTPESLWKDFPSIIESIEEPLGTTSILPMWSLVQRAREDVTVVLTGQGSDEPWGGYRKYQQELIRAHAPEWIWNGVKKIPIHPSYPDPIRRGIRSIPHSNPVDRFLENYALFSGPERSSLTGRNDSGIAKERILYWLAWQQAKSIPYAEQMMRIDTRMNLCDDLLLYGDKISMAFGLEARVPMLDIRLVEWIESLPLRYKCTINKGKRIHKSMAEQYLPKEIVHRPKKGFQVPFGTWCRGIWNKRVEERLLSSGSPHLALLNKKAIETIWKQHQKGVNHERVLFALLSFSIWADQQAGSVHS
ncbi:MAG: asparagine synthase (glutamine-hydrolyzing) [Deltaproteobacteria bacterium]|nr:asparagine synthase (glutamine-hydrolyzing) [Deltaproteobacteria bacterium]